MPWRDSPSAEETPVGPPVHPTRIRRGTYFRKASEEKERLLISSDSVIFTMSSLT